MAVGKNPEGLKHYVAIHLNEYLTLFKNGSVQLNRPHSELRREMSRLYIRDYLQPEGDISMRIFDTCIAGFTQRRKSDLTLQTLYELFLGEATADLRAEFGGTPAGLLQYLKQNFSGRLEFSADDMRVKSLDIERYERDKAEQVNVSDHVNSLPKSRKQLENERFEAIMNERPIDPFNLELESKACHFFLALFRALGDPPKLPLQLAMKYLKLYNDRALANYLVGSANNKKNQNAALAKYFKERSHVFQFHQAPPCPHVTLQPPCVRDTVFLLNHNLAKRAATGGRTFHDVRTLWVHTRRISDEARQILGSDVEALKEFLNAHPWIFKPGFNFSMINSLHELPLVNAGKVLAFNIIFDVDRAELDRILAGEKPTPLVSSDPKAPMPSTTAANECSTVPRLKSKNVLPASKVAPSESYTDNAGKASSPQSQKPSTHSTPPPGLGLNAVLVGDIPRSMAAMLPASPSGMGTVIENPTENDSELSGSTNRTRTSPQPTRSVYSDDSEGRFIRAKVRAALRQAKEKTGFNPVAKSSQDIKSPTGISASDNHKSAVGSKTKSSFSTPAFNNDMDEANSDFNRISSYQRLSNSAANSSIPEEPFISPHTTRVAQNGLTETDELLFAAVSIGIDGAYIPSVYDNIQYSVPKAGSSMPNGSTQSQYVPSGPPNPAETQTFQKRRIISRSGKIASTELVNGPTPNQASGLSKASQLSQNVQQVNQERCPACGKASSTTDDQTPTLNEVKVSASTTGKGGTVSKTEKRGAVSESEKQYRDATVDVQTELMPPDDPREPATKPVMVDSAVQTVKTQEDILRRLLSTKDYVKRCGGFTSTSKTT